MSRNNAVTVGQTPELMCRVRGSRLPMTLTWSRQQGASTIDILTLYANGSISWSVNQQRYQLKVENKVTEVIYYLLINGASHEEAGNYTCLVSVFLEEIHRKLPASNHLGVEVQNPGTDEICEAACHLLEQFGMKAGLFILFLFYFSYFLPFHREQTCSDHHRCHVCKCQHRHRNEMLGCFQNLRFLTLLCHLAAAAAGRKEDHCELRPGCPSDVRSEDSAEPQGANRREAHQGP